MTEVARLDKPLLCYDGKSGVAGLILRLFFSAKSQSTLAVFGSNLFILYKVVTLLTRNNKGRDGAVFNKQNRSGGTDTDVLQDLL